ncbi:hypothetical protein BaRGS_00011501 [Batillaria attramentaria]|uniref:Uncharacterized protein n=1 Tax=Batillaria attramentaria TaxID=370345 RepID=A0ABD0LCA2_9CAEN
MLPQRTALAVLATSVLVTLLCVVSFGRWRPLPLASRAAGLLSSETGAGKIRQNQHSNSVGLSPLSFVLTSEQFPKEQEYHTHCDDVLQKMTKGHWLPRNVTSQEILDLEVFHKKREDKQCRTVTFPGATSWWRALCDKDGDTPCCYDNVCVNRSRESCTCSNCLDLRQVIQAELSTWVPVEPACRVRSLSVEEICRILDTATIYFIGDSLTRHTYTAFLLAVRGNELTGAMLNNTPPGKIACK